MQIIPTAKTKISLYFRAEDGAWTKRYTTLKGAQKEAARMIGATPELGLGYAVSMYGTTLRCDGCTLTDLFPALMPAEPATRTELDFDTLEDWLDSPEFAAITKRAIRNTPRFSAAQ